MKHTIIFLIIFLVVHGNTNSIELSLKMLHTIYFIKMPDIHPYEELNLIAQDFKGSYTEPMDCAYGRLAKRVFKNTVAHSNATTTMLISSYCIGRGKISVWYLNHRLDCFEYDSIANISRNLPDTAIVFRVFVLKKQTVRFHDLYESFHFLQSLN